MASLLDIISGLAPRRETIDLEALTGDELDRKCDSVDEFFSDSRSIRHAARAERDRRRALAAERAEFRRGLDVALLR